MSKSIPNLHISSILLAPLVIFGCSDSTDSSVSGVSATVPTGAVTVTAENAEEIISAAIIEGDSLVGLADTLTAVEINKPPSTRNIIDLVIDKAKNANGVFVISTPTGITLTDSCTGGGTFSSDFNETESSLVGTITFTNCIELDITLDGTINFNSTWNNVTSDYSDTVSGFLSGTQGTETVTISGLDFNETGNEISGEYSLNRYTLITDYTSGGGFLTQLQASVVGNVSESCPRSGIILVTGASSTQAKATIIPGTNVLSDVGIEINDGSGTFTELPNSPFPCTNIFTSV